MMNIEIEENFIVEDNIIKSSSKYAPSNYGLGYEFFRAMTEFKNNIAQYISETDEIDTYGDLLLRSIRTALTLKLEGLENDDVVCLCTYNHRDSSTPFIASQFLGLKIASLDPSLSLHDTVHLLKQVKPKIIFLVPEAIQLIEDSLIKADFETKLVIFGENEKYKQFSDFLLPQVDEDEFKPKYQDSYNETSTIFFSSGTTGLPKGICQSHYALICQSINMMYTGKMGNNWNKNNLIFSNYKVVTTVSLYYSSLYWISGVIFLISSIFSGSARVVCKTYNPAELWNLIEKYKISLIFMSPTQLIDLCNYEKPEGINTSSLLCLWTGGTSIPLRKLLHIRDLLPGTFVCQAYGQTEVAGLLTCFQMDIVRDSLHLHYKPDSCGRPIPGVFYKVVNTETEQTLGPNQQGELRIKSKYVMNGYYRLSSSSAFDENGWLKTGDIVYYDDDYCFYIVDRIKEMLKYKSWHVAPANIEQVLEKHIGIKKAIVIGIHNDDDGDHPLAIVQLEDDYHITAEDIENYVAEHLSDKEKLRGGVKFVNDFPLTPSGKIKRNEIKKLVYEGKI